MTTYSYTIGTTPADFNNNTQLVEKMVISNDHQQASSNDAVTGGSTVVTAEGRYKTISSVHDLLPTDRVTIGGVEMEVQAARAAGFSNFLEGLADKSAKAVQKHAIEGKPLDEPETTKEEQEALELDYRVGSGLTSYEEVNAGRNIADTFAFHTGVAPEDSAAFVTEILTGEAPDTDPVWDRLVERGMSRESTHAMVDRAVGIGQQVAQRELGYDKYGDLQRMADRSNSIRNLVIQHGIARASGKTTLTWNDIYNVAKQHEAQ
ncbi:MAG: hypothetical protein ACK5TD_00770 [bacterium]